VTNSIPPKDKAEVAKVSLITHTVIDLAAIVATSVFVITDKLESTTGIAIIALIAGVWLNNASNNKNNLPPGASSVVLGAISGVYKTLIMLGKT
jgi:hypothetical protein